MDQEPPVRATLEIRRNADGLIRREPKPQDYYGDFIWSEGNFACDCNRYSFFCWAAGEEEAEDEDAPEHRCGMDRYSVRLTDSDGKVLYSDFDK